MKTEVKIIRWSKPVLLENGTLADIKCMICSKEEAAVYAEKIAKKNNATVAAII